jgi:hypothetical protein
MRWRSNRGPGTAIPSSVLRRLVGFQRAPDLRGPAVGPGIDGAQGGLQMTSMVPLIAAKVRSVSAWTSRVHWFAERLAERLVPQAPTVTMRPMTPAAPAVALKDSHVLPR